MEEKTEADTMGEQHMSGPIKSVEEFIAWTTEHGPMTANWDEPQTIVPRYLAQRRY